ncbi:hypothetical protein D3H65_20645 [Paraflavitalea soli]|uniref:Lipoprotein n=1 Tax=Paraflavitalea soli TaxID=2315862 RepID=A0A3B7MP24_9BACT|nr:hypothetical protein [Paraflavitalea soli]AXY76252.1 hypothetical protein D3H65_20645 [Paraflavitalea soli]
MKSNLTSCLLIVLLLAACRQANQPHTITRGFYYWKSNVDLNASEKNALDTLQVKKLYIKFFDVVWDPTGLRPMPVAKVQLSDSTSIWLSRHPVEIIPTVFITNECMQLIDSSNVAILADRLHDLMAAIANQLPDNSSIHEIQLDCDWTATSKNNYFSLLTRLQALPFFQQKEVSATIRLYQCKYKQKTGVPPVGRGLLMCYNMGNLKSQHTRNSILEAAELEKYIGNLQEYPLPLDVALPLFDWKVLYQDHAYKGLIQGLPDSLLQQKGISRKTGSNTFTILLDTILNGYPLKKGDDIRQEDASFAEIMQATRLLRSKLVTPKITVALFHLDSLTLHKYSTYELEEIFDSLH